MPPYDPASDEDPRDLDDVVDELGELSRLIRLLSHDLGAIERHLDYVHGVLVTLLVVAILGLAVLSALYFRVHA